MKLSKIRKNWWEILLLLVVLVLAGFLRFYQLGKVPASPDWDEASLGYNAYSIAKTGRDEYGQAYPFFLRSFGDYKPAVYAYLAILPIKIFGLNLFSIRFPAAALGTLAVLVVYFLTKELFSQQKRASFLALTAAFLLAISPWHLQFSRVAFESNIGVFFNMVMALFFLKGLKKPWFLVLAAFFAGLNLYVYQAEKIFTPCLFLAMVFIWHKKLFKMPRRFLILAVMVGLIMISPFVRTILTTQEVFLRARGTSFAADQTPFLARTVEKLSRDYKNRDYLGLILDNRRVTYLVAFVDSYLSHFDLNWLFISGDDTRHHAPGVGLLYLWELPFFLLGIYALIFDKKLLKRKFLIFSWLFLAPIPAAFTSGVPHAVRTLRFLPIMQIFTALGIVVFWSKIKEKAKLKFLIILILGGFFVFNFGYFLNQYFVQLNYFTSQAWQYGYQPAIEEINKIEGQYKKIVVSNQAPLDQSYIFFLFHLRYDPKTYQQAGGTEKAFGKYVFKAIDWPNEKKTPEILYVSRPGDFPEEAKVLKVINFLNGEPAMKIVGG